MNLKKIFLYTAATFVLAVNSAVASKEGTLPLSEFDIRSRGIGDSGIISINGIQKDTGLVKLRIFAFNRDFNLQPPQLAQINGFLLNGMQISYERGYRIAGGKKLYIRLLQNLSYESGRSVLLEINENGAISINFSTN